jgi:glucosyl-3-phosphoglycerate synthase
MDFAQERVTTLHALSGPDRIPPAPTDRAAVLVPVAARDIEKRTVDRVFSALESVSPERVVVAVRADSEDVRAIERRLAGYALPIEVLWCNGPRLERALAGAGIDGPAGKGRDVWLGLALATRSAFVAVHGVDTASYTDAYVPRLIAPLAEGFNRTTPTDERNDERPSGAEAGGYAFTKGYYARIEGARLYGRLCRLLYEPLIAALRTRRDAAVLAYLDAFRYGLAGEFAMTTTLARQVRVRPNWGLEVGLLGEARRIAGADRVVQTDLGVHDHDHRAVSGIEGLSAMARSVADALLAVIEAGGVELEYAALRERYRKHATRHIRAYSAEARFNGLAYDATAERKQVRAYAESITPPDGPARLPAWDEGVIDPATVREAVRADREALLDGLNGSEHGEVVE